MTNLSRRTLVTSAAALPALTVPALASFSPDHPDAELLRLAVQLEIVGREIEAETERAIKDSAEREAICERAGLPNIYPCDWPGGFAKYNEWFEYQDKRRALAPLADEDKDDENGQTAIGRIMDRVDPIVDAILAFQPTTLDGLKVQARALVFGAPDLWYLDRQEHQFIGAVFTFLGVDKNGKPLTA